METIDKLLKKPLWYNVLVGIGAFLIVFLLFFFSLGLITGNGKTEKVPTVIGLDINTAEQNLKALGFDVVLQDSIYVDTLPKNTILRQNPEADEIVRKGRTIYLTINRVLAPQVEMPNLVGFSLQSAQMYLKALGLRVGAITLVPDKNSSVVLDQLLNGVPIAAGSKISSGSGITLLVGDGSLSELIEVPDLIGLTVDMARAKILSAGFIVGGFTSSASIQDTAAAFVIGQDPGIQSMILDSTGQPKPNRKLRGATINLSIDLSPPIKIQTDTINDF